MQELEQALEDVKALHEKVFGYPAPNLPPLPILPSERTRS